MHEVQLQEPRPKAPQEKMTLKKEVILQHTSRKGPEAFQAGRGTVFFMKYPADQRGACAFGEKQDVPDGCP